MDIWPITKLYEDYPYSVNVTPRQNNMSSDSPGNVDTILLRDKNVNKSTNYDS